MSERVRNWSMQTLPENMSFADDEVSIGNMVSLDDSLNDSGNDSYK